MAGSPVEQAEWVANTVVELERLAEKDPGTVVVLDTVAVADIAVVGTVVDFAVVADIAMVADIVEFGVAEVVDTAVVDLAVAGIELAVVAGTELEVVAAEPVVAVDTVVAAEQVAAADTVVAAEPVVAADTVVAAELVAAADTAVFVWYSEFFEEPCICLPLGYKHQHFSLEEVDKIEVIPYLAMVWKRNEADLFPHWLMFLITTKTFHRSLAQRIQYPFFLLRSSYKFCILLSPRPSSLVLSL